MKLTLHLIITLIAITSIFSSRAEDQHAITNGDEVVGNITLKPIVVYDKGVDQRRYWRLVKSVKRVYPIAKFAREKMQGMNDTLATMSRKSDQKAYIRKIYKEIKEEYTPILLKMSMTDGRVLIRLIDRETDYTAYEVLDEFKGKLTAAFWQGIGRMFGQNLKSEFGSSSEDRMIEMIIIYYEAGLI